LSAFQKVLLLRCAINIIIGAQYNLFLKSKDAYNQLSDSFL
jgi:hypothetical protein